MNPSATNQHPKRTWRPPSGTICVNIFPNTFPFTPRGTVLREAMSDSSDSPTAPTSAPRATNPITAVTAATNSAFRLGTQAKQNATTAQQNTILANQSASNLTTTFSSGVCGASSAPGPVMTGPPLIITLASPPNKSWRPVTSSPSSGPHDTPISGRKKQTTVAPENKRQAMRFQ